MSAPRFLTALQRLIDPERLVLDPARLATYGCDGLTQYRGSPLAVAHAETREEVQALVRLCQREDVKITARGAGTGLAGGATPTDGALVIALNRMRAIRHIDPEDRFAIVEPGVTNASLGEAARAHGLFFAPDPSSQAVSTLGGNVAANAGGPHALRYGSTREHILALEVVMADGEVQTFGSVRGEDGGASLLSLILGSEGTLGIVTAITCRLTKAPAEVLTLLAAFQSMEAACRAVRALVARGLRPAALEAMDQKAIQIVEDSPMRAGLPRDAGAILLIEFAGTGAAVFLEAELCEGICRAEGATLFLRADTPEAAAKLWRGRKAAFGAMGRLARDLYVQDAVVPRSKLPEVLPALEAIAKDLDLLICNVFHAGDGNLHPSISYDGEDPQALAKVHLAGKRIAEVCLAAGGTLSGEHGIGLEKRAFLDLEFGPAELLAFQSLREVFDPRGLLNPDKRVPTNNRCGEMRGAKTRRDLKAPLP